jgi:pimeloyl-ACP methyl ester carboxylesterase
MTEFQVGPWRFHGLVEGSGDPVLLLHGFPQDMYSWDAVATDLHTRGYQTIRFDQRGYSPSARPSTVADYRIHHLVDDAFGVVDQVRQQPVHVIGHDWGAAVAWAMAIMRPERIRTLTVLSTPHPRALATSLRSGRQALRSWYMGVFQIPRLPEKLLAPGGRGWDLLVRGLPAAHRERYAERARDQAALTAMLHWYRAMRVTARGGDPIVRVPTLYFWGGRDPALGRDAAQRTAAYVDGRYRFVVLPRHGHWLPERAADVMRDPLLEHLQTG